MLRFDQLHKNIGCEEQTYILTLQTVDIWQRDGFVKNLFTPMWTYENPGDKNFAYYPRLQDKEGNNYYVSFPPFAFWVAYWILWPFDIEYGKIVLQLANLLLHFTAAFLLYLIIGKLSLQRKRAWSIPALTAFMVYLFMPATTYLHTSIFFPEMLAQVMWLWALYLSFHFWQSDNKSSAKSSYLFFFVFIIFIYTEWLALFYSVTLAGIILFGSNIQKKKKILTTLILISVGTPILLLLQYGMAGGFENLINAMGIRFLERSGFFGEAYSSMGVHIFSVSSLLIYLKNLHKALVGPGYLIIALSILSLLLFYKDTKKIITTHKKPLFLVFIPVLLHNIVFFNANALHYLLMARWTVPLAFTAALICHVLQSRKRLSYIVLPFVIGVFVYGGSYYRNNLTISIDTEKIDKVVSVIKGNARPEQSVLVYINTTCAEPEKYLTYKSKRNVISLENKVQADSLLQLHNKSEGLVIYEENGFYKTVLIKPN